MKNNVRVITGWFTAIILALVLNTTLFALMPGLVQSIPKKPSSAEQLNAIQVIRIKRPEIITPKTQSIKPRPPEKKKIRKLPQRTIIAPSVQKLHLPFTLNPKLPVSNQTLSMPAMEKLELKIPALKNAYGSHEIDAPLIPLFKIPPIYPLRAKSNAIEGWVKVRFLVNQTGGVNQIKIIDATPANIFELSVKNCLSKWRFKPGTIEGVPVNTYVTTTILFELEH